MGNKTKGLLALVGLGALAYWKYKNSSPEQKQMVKDKFNNAKDNLNKWGNDIKDRANNVASQVQEKADEFKSQAKDTVNKAQETVS